MAEGCSVDRLSFPAFTRRTIAAPLAFAFRFGGGVTIADPVSTTGFFFRGGRL